MSQTIPKCSRCGAEHWLDIHSGRWHHVCSKPKPKPDAKREEPHTGRPDNR